MVLVDGSMEKVLRAHRKARREGAASEGRLERVRVGMCGSRCASDALRAHHGLGRCVKMVLMSITAM